MYGEWDKNKFKSEQQYAQPAWIKYSGLFSLYSCI